MSAASVVIEILQKTRYGKRVESLVLKIFGRELTNISLETPEKLAARTARAAAREEATIVRFLSASVVAEYLQRHLLPKLRKLVGNSATTETLVRIVDEAARAGNKGFKAIRGFVLEHLLRDLPQTRALVRYMNQQVLGRLSRSVRKGWSPARLVAGALDSSGRQVGDLLIISEHTDGRVWVMAILESKSLSNIGDLAALKEVGGQDVGQHLWGLTRLKAGASIEGRTLKAGQIVGTPMDVGAKTLVEEGAPRTFDSSGKTFRTLFVGFGPDELTAGQLRKLADQAVRVEMWRWPFETDELDSFVRELLERVRPLAALVAPPG